jgi:hypothetical protein
MSEQTNWAVWSASEITPPKIRLRREDNKGARFYWWIGDEGVKTGAGITTIISGVMPESKFLTDWKLKYGDKWKEVLNDTANYGSLMHLCFLERMTTGEVNQAMLDSMRALSLKNGQSHDQPEKNVYSFLKFVEDIKVEPLIFEGMLVAEFKGENYCMTLDLLAKAKKIIKRKELVEVGVYVRGDKKGQPKFEETTIVEEKDVYMICDFKSNYFEKESKSFFEEHKYQLIAARRAVKQNFGIDVEMICNFSPNNWRNEPTYTLMSYDISDKDEQLFDAHMELARLKGLFIPKGFKLIPTGFKHSSDYKKMSYEEYVTEIAVEEQALQEISLQVQ